MAVLLILSLVVSFSCDWCQEKFIECKKDCASLQGIEWSMCVDKCMEKDRRCRGRCEP